VAADALDGEALRLAVIAAGAPEIRAMLGPAEVTAVASTRWESSPGPVQGYAVTVALCAEDLAAVDASPGARDLLERACALAVGATPDHAMTSLVARWNRRGAVRVTTYREAATTSVAVTLGEALRRYLAVSDDDVVGPDELWVEEVVGGVVATTPRTARRPERGRVELALAALLGARTAVRWSVRSGE
jgi:hypothetical protein